MPANKKSLHQSHTHCFQAHDVAVSEEKADSGVISRGTPRSLLQTCVLCAKVLYATRTAFTVKILSVVFSVLLMAFLMMFGGGVTVPSLYVAIYQLFWLIPVFMISKVYI